ncbi:MAG: hypothetical protein K0S09_2803 [Sphingobacteriaceae bacterium]|jgi:hypothetical protein|nr:hypothetical protein [Sphingobacteriaceae bacterium]
MKKALYIILAIVLGLTFKALIKDSFETKAQEKATLSTTDPWITKSLHKIFIELPYDWETVSKTLPETLKPIIAKQEYHQIKRDDIFLMNIYWKINDGYYQSWDLDKSATAGINNIFFTLKCKDLELKKIESSSLEVIYRATATCKDVKKVVDVRAMMLNDELYTTAILYDYDNKVMAEASKRILASIKGVR